jgi:hypothetical protein
VGNDRSGDVVASAEPSVETARVSDSGSAGVVTVPAGRSWNERTPTRTVVSRPKSTTVSIPS